MNRKQNLSVSGIISLGLSLLLILLSLFVVFINTSLNSNYTEQLNRSNILSSLQEMKNGTIAAINGFSSYIESGSLYKLSDYYAYTGTVDSSFESLSILETYSDETLYTLSSLEITIDAFKTECERTLNYYNASSANMYENLAKAKMISSYIDSYIDSLQSTVIESDVLRLSSELSSYKQTLVLSFLFIIFFLLFILFIIYLFRTRLKNPITTLASQATKLSRGDFSARSKLSKADRSVVLLSETFNNMAKEIDQMLLDLKDKVDAEEKLLEERRKNLEYEAMLDKATFLVLQTQTNPHFLYNTLNTISRTITLGQYKDSQTMLKALSHLMRYNLSDVDTPAILREEIGITKEYLEIQRLRFKDRVNYSVNIPDEILDTLELPRFTLQPLVENSIIHGIEPLEKGGKIVIDGKRRGKNIVVRILDTGSGFDIKKLENKKKGIGIENTKKRLKLFFHREDAMKILSKEGRGTLVIITAGDANEEHV